jgi:hypothetical protein
MEARQLLITSVDDLKSTLRCMEKNGQTNTKAIEEALDIYDGAPGKFSKTKRKMLEATLKRWNAINNQAEQKLLQLTSEEEWEAMSIDEKFVRLKTAEFDRNGYYRNGRDTKKKLEAELEELKAKMARWEEAEKNQIAIQEQASRDSWAVYNKNKLLRKQLEDAGITPLY